MGNVILFKPQIVVTAVQLSANPQEDGSILYTVESLNNDDTWDILDTAKDKSEGWLRAGDAARRLGVPLLPKSIFPGRAA